MANYVKIALHDGGLLLLLVLVCSTKRPTAVSAPLYPLNHLLFPTCCYYM